MLLWFWGNNKKKLFFGGQTVPLNSFLKLGDTSDSQVSLTIAQQKVRSTTLGPPSSARGVRSVSWPFAAEISAVPI